MFRYALTMLEPYEVKVSRTVLRGLGTGNGSRLPDDHRSIKRITRPMLGFKEFYSASITLRGIELVRMIRKGQMINQNDAQNLAKIFYSLAA